MKRLQMFSTVRLFVLSGLIAAATPFGPLEDALAQGARNPNPGIAPPNSRPFGLTYGEWAAKWWQAALATPILETSTMRQAAARRPRCGKS